MLFYINSNIHSQNYKIKTDKMITEVFIEFDFGDNKSPNPFLPPDPINFPLSNPNDLTPVNVWKTFDTWWNENLKLLGCDETDLNVLKQLVFDINFDPIILNSTYNGVDKTYQFGKHTIVVVAKIDSSLIDTLSGIINKIGFIKGVYISPEIKFCSTGTTPDGKDVNVAAELEVTLLKQKGMTGKNVLVAVVDGGIDPNNLNSICVANNKINPNFYNDARFTIDSPPDVTHGTSVAYDLLIAAPECTILDAPIPDNNGTFNKTLTGAMKVYAALEILFTEIKANTNPNLKGFKNMVITNSWAMDNTSEEQNLQSNAKYSDNHDHPFNRIVAQLASLGADIVFAAGNCGDGADGCQGIKNTIYGANSHQDILCVTGATVLGKELMNYSNKGPGLLTEKKPDIVGFTEFSVNNDQQSPIHTGTSAACPVIAGVIAAIRASGNYSDTIKFTPQQMRDLLINNSTKGAVISLETGADTSSDWIIPGTQNQFGIIDVKKLVPNLIPLNLFFHNISP